MATCNKQQRMQLEDQVNMTDDALSDMQNEERTS